MGAKVLVNDYVSKVKPKTKVETKPLKKTELYSPETGIIEDARFKTYGCGSAIASSSLVTEILKGKTLQEASTIKNSAIAEELALPPVKIHCSVLAEDAIKAAIKDYELKCSCK
jgi:NifU-like protein involved in Fe-S cluster formation